ncbi:ankyrin repeat domain-containing protein [Carboxylicivirga sp. A043]|uniref:ankyrin repeat domain-containing protein n=1 Tax=Carboxylicivirga litoralis TaxID=2816963 RepID=UPI0021CB757A|nr:ankyrin repeat domain-containing protein [Carboxylicivirga sp. A043]MCU4155160.1 ankyrin repeat domain-containing protein [Carboxylicivirga sp. A043]
MKLIKKSRLLVIILLIGFGCQSPTKQSQSENTVTPESAEQAIAKPAINMAEYFEAALNGNIDLVQKAIDSGVDIEARNENGYTALMLSGYNGHHHIIKLLLEHKPNIDAVDGLNRTALMFASTGPFEAAVEVLIKAGANVNAIDSHENWTPVMFAAGEGQLGVIKLLVANGADLNKVDIDGESALDFAQTNGHTEAAKYIQSQLK